MPSLRIFHVFWRTFWRIFGSTFQWVFWALLTLATITACGSGGEDTAPPIKDEPPTPVVPNDNSVLPPSHEACPEGTKWSYETLGEGFMLTYCTACHSAFLTGEHRHEAPVGVDFDTPDQVQIWRASIIERLTKGDMPPARHVDAESKTAMLEWLNCGAPAGIDRIK